jgi:hypothetical protein
MTAAKHCTCPSRQLVDTHSGPSCRQKTELDQGVNFSNKLLIHLPLNRCFTGVNILSAPARPKPGWTDAQHDTSTSEDAQHDTSCMNRQEECSTPDVTFSGPSPVKHNQVSPLPLQSCNTSLPSLAGHSGCNHLHQPTSWMHATYILLVIRDSQPAVWQKRVVPCLWSLHHGPSVPPRPTHAFAAGKPHHPTQAAHAEQVLMRSVRPTLFTEGQRVPCCVYAQPP